MSGMAKGGRSARLHQPNSKCAIQDKRLLGLICDSYVANGGVYGSPRMFADLHEAGEACGKHFIERIMHHNKTQSVRGYKSPKTVKVRPSMLAPNCVNSRFTVYGQLGSVFYP